MTAEKEHPIPVWTLTTEAISTPDLGNDSVMTPERLTELRSALAALADTPLVTLEAHPLPKERARGGGIPLRAGSPLARHLSQLVAQTAESSSAAAKAAMSGEVLYRMVVPAKVAAQVGSGFIRPMTSKAAAGGIHGALVGSGKIVSQATFVPVAGQTAGGVSGTAVRAGAVTVAAPLLLMAVAGAASAYADYKREQAPSRITDLLEKLHNDKLEEERSQLDGCRDAITKATAVLLDKGKVEAALGVLHG